MAEDLFDFSQKELKEILANKELAFLKKQKARPKSKEARTAAFLKEKLKIVKTPEQLLKTLISGVLEKEFGAGILAKPYFEKMVVSIAESIVANSSVKNRFLKLAAKYLTTPSDSSSKKKD